MIAKQFLSFQTVTLDIENLWVDFCHQDPPSYMGVVCVNIQWGRFIFPSYNQKKREHCI